MDTARSDSPTWQWAVLRLRASEPQVPVSWVLLEGHGDALEVGELGQLGHVVPAGVRQPGGTGVVHLLVLVQDLETTPHTHLHTSGSGGPQPGPHLLTGDKGVKIMDRLAGCRLALFLLMGTDDNWFKLVCELVCTYVN